MPTPEIIPEEPSRTLVETNLDLQEQWRISSLLIGSDNHQVASIRLAPGRVVMHDGHFGNRGSRLVAFSTSTGRLDWQVKHGRSVSSIAVDQNRLYIAHAGDPLQAYELQSGELAWLSVELPERVLYFLQVQDDVLFNFSRGLLQFFNPETGELLAEERWETPSNSLRFMRLDGFELHQTTSDLFRLNVETSGVVWRAPIDEDSGFPLRFPELSNNRLILTYGRIDYDVYAIDFLTGQRLWKADSFFVSNAAVAQGKVYVLREDARLLVFDEITGRELGYAQFALPKTDPGGETYWVGANEEGQVFVYFSDSQELVALGPKA
jgi:outer membrane protein assembly factor BamB